MTGVLQPCGVVTVDKVDKVRIGERAKSSALSRSPCALC